MIYVHHKARYTIGDLEPATSYNLRITATNNAGSTITEFAFETLNHMGLLMDNEMDHLGFSGSLEPLYLQANFLAITVILILCTVVIVAGTYFCLKAGKVFIFHSLCPCPPRNKYFTQQMVRYSLEEMTVITDLLVDVKKIEMQINKRIFILMQHSSCLSMKLSQGKDSYMKHERILLRVVKASLHILLEKVMIDIAKVTIGQELKEEPSGYLQRH